MCGQAKENSPNRRYCTVGTKIWLRLRSEGVEIIMPCRSRDPGRACPYFDKAKLALMYGR